MSYLNTKPLLYGIERSQLFKEIELVQDYPARIAQLLIDDKVDVGLIPVAATTKLPKWHMITDYGIGADGDVCSVCIFSQVPIHEVRTLILDYQSRTSVNLARILLKEYWKIDPEIQEATGEEFRSAISGTTAAVVIGDRALEDRSRARYIYDLAGAWKHHTGLPFIFAGWIANKALPREFVERFNAANQWGYQHITEFLSSLPSTNRYDFDLNNYYLNCIRYELTTAMREGMSLFLNKLTLK